VDSTSRVEDRLDYQRPPPTRSAPAQGLAHRASIDESLLESGDDNGSRIPVIAAPGGEVDDASGRACTTWEPSRMHILVIELGAPMRNKATRSRPLCAFRQRDEGLVLLETLETVVDKGAGTSQDRARRTDNQDHEFALFG